MVKMVKRLLRFLQKKNKKQKQKQNKTKNSKNKTKKHKKFMEISKDNNYSERNWLGYEYISRHCQLISIDLSKLKEPENPKTI